MYEGRSAGISCVSSGAPVPTVSWTFRGRTTPFNQTDQSTGAIVLSGSVTHGYLRSTLQMVNVQYPTHDGVYSCTGSNDPAGKGTTTITVQVLGILILRVYASESVTCKQYGETGLLL